MLQDTRSLLLTIAAGPGRATIVGPRANLPVSRPRLRKGALAREVISVGYRRLGPPTHDELGPEMRLRPKSRKAHGK